MERKVNLNNNEFILDDSIIIVYHSLGYHHLPMWYFLKKLLIQEWESEWD